MPAKKKTARAKPKTSAKKLAAVRANGKKGGRPRKSSPTAFADIEPPPVGDPLAIATWAQGIVAKQLYEETQGRGNRELSVRIRALAGSIARLVPMERLNEAEKRIKEARAPAKPHTRKGPEMEPYVESAAQRRGRSVRR